MDALTRANSPVLSSSPLQFTANQDKNATNARNLSENDSLQNDSDGSPKKESAYKRGEEPPRDHEDNFICKHPECSGLTFHRKCEWK